MNLLHDPTTRHEIEQRVRGLTPQARGRWGKMSVDQMLWHVNEALAVFAGEKKLPAGKPPLPPAILKFAVLKLPWMKNAPTNPSFVAKASHDLDAEKTRCLRLIDAIVRRPIEGLWIAHPDFGPMTGKEVSRLQAKHLDHHLRQFGA